MKKRRRREGPPTSPLDIFGEAQSFQLSARVLNEQAEKAIFLMPTAVNECFAVELYLKALHRIRRRYVTGHNIQVLFSRLSRDDQKAVELRYNAIVVSHRGYHEAVSRGLALDLPSVLLRNRNSFEKIRYWFEKEPPLRDDRGHVSNAGLGSLGDAVRDYILVLRPEWAEIQISVTAELISQIPPTLPSRQTPE